MTDRNLLDYLDAEELNVNRTPNRQLGMGRLSRSRRSSVRKSGKFRMLYTPKESLGLEEGVGDLYQPLSKRMRLSSTSHNATIGDGSHIDSSFDVVDVTPGINRTQTLPFQSCLNNFTSVSGRIFEVVPKSMQQHNPVYDLSHKHYVERLSTLSSSLETHTDGQNTMRVAEKMFEGEGSISPAIRGITRLQATKTFAMGGKSTSPVFSIDGNSSVITDRMCTRQADSADHTKLDEVCHSSELAQTSHRTEQVSSMRKSLQFHAVEDELPATQPLDSFLLKDVIAYVEVRSGGDNRSMGIKAHLRSLGATVRDKFTNDVTHVVFNDGLWSTYKKAVKKKVHLVSVSWIEECKKARTIVSERLYPPYDTGKYESPYPLKRFRKVKSLQPDFEGMGEQKVKKRRQKKFIFNVNEHEPEIELPGVSTYKKPIKVPEFLQNVSNENGLVRTLLSVADIGPEYEKVVNRPDSPTLSEEEDFSIPLAVRLLRKILTPQSSPDLPSSGEEAADRLNRTPVTKSSSCASSAADIQVTPMGRCGQPPQRINKDEFCNFTSDGNAYVGEEVGNAGTEICNVNTEGNNLSQLSPQTPTHDRSGKMPLMKQRKILSKNVLLCSKDNEAKNAKYRISSETFQTTTTPVNSVKEPDQLNEVQKGKKQECGAVDSITLENSNYESGNHAEVNNAKIIEVSENHQVDIENLAVRTCSSQSMNKEVQFPNMSSGAGVGRRTSMRKRKLFPLLQFNSPEVLNTDVSTVRDDTSHLPLQCPYVTGGKAAGGKKRKSLDPVGDASVKKLSPCLPSTSVSIKQKRRQSHKKFNSSSDKKHGTVSKVVHSSRGSLDEFVRVAEQPLEKEDKPRKMLEKKLPSLVCTGLHRHEVEVVTSVVKKLGGFLIEANVSEKTTHVVTQGPRRTLNLLRGLVRGCWIVLQEWVLKSLDADMWLEEGEFELTDFSPAVKHCRMQKQSFGPVYSLDLFSTCGHICVSRDSVPSKRDLEELITLCGGRIGPSLRSARILVGSTPSVRNKDLKCVNEKWVLDSIQFSTLKPLSEYALL